MAETSDTDYRLAPAFAARLVGLGLVLLAVLAFAFTAASLVLSWPADLVVVAVVVGLVAVLATASWLRSRAYVVRLTESGYRVRFVRGVGVAEGRWDEVSEAATAHPRDVPCLVLRRHDGTTTSIPVEMLAVDRERFADDVRTRLDRAAGRP
ncbi:hypothetical protein [Nocardioides sp.]|uniref:hypothetical protein n=1 Tax=Nocardioides sp. TaxID=35761 RepID=UPI00271B1668|nr:hypothetical protein [Nocardioides sp.]MDO9455443.1 hypothetical protein [Nocardioides sp.]